MTQAEMISELLDNDGLNWTAKDGRSFEEIAREMGAEFQATGFTVRATERYSFSDGSAILATGAMWGLEGDEPYSWACLDA